MVFLLCKKNFSYSDWSLHYTYIVHRNTTLSWTHRRCYKLLPLESLEEPGHFNIILIKCNIIMFVLKKRVNTYNGLRVSKSKGNFHFWVSSLFKFKTVENETVRTRLAVFTMVPDHVIFTTFKTVLWCFLF